MLVCDPKPIFPPPRSAEYVRRAKANSYQYKRRIAGVEAPDLIS